MFGRPAAPQKDWGDMYLYEKVHHLVDHAANFVISKSNWWVPSVGLGMALSLLVLGGPDGIAQGVGIVLPSLTPVARAPPFAMPADLGAQGGPPEEEEF